MGEVLDEVYELWEKANIPTIQKKNSLTKSMKMWQKYVSITAKNPKRLCRIGAKKLTGMTEDCGKLFDLATPRAVDLIQRNRLLTMEEKKRDIEFYVDQKGDRIGKMTNRDRQYDEKMKKKQHRIEIMERGAKNGHAQEDPLEGPSTMKTGCESDEGEAKRDDTSETDGDSDVNETGDGTRWKTSTVTVNLPRKLLKSPAICNMADRLLLSHDQVFGMVSAVIKSADPPVDLNEFALSKSTVRRGRRSCREAANQMIRDSFAPPQHVVVHWDSKLLQDALGLPEHRLAILVSGAGHEGGKLLSVPPVADATGLQQSQATLKALDEWDIRDRVRGLCFDTTSSNTGRLRGAMVRLELALGHRIFRFACRHHVLELVVGGVAKSLFGPTTGPSNPLFEKLKVRWAIGTYCSSVINVTCHSPCIVLSMNSKKQFSPFVLAVKGVPYVLYGAFFAQQYDQTCAFDPNPVTCHLLPCPSIIECPFLSL